MDPQSAEPKFCGQCGQVLDDESLAAGLLVHQVCPSPGGFPAALGVPLAPTAAPRAAVPSPAPVPTRGAGPASTGALAVRPRLSSGAGSALGERLAGRPREIPSVGAWIAGAFVRRLAPVTVGIFAAWFNLPLVVLMGAIGAVLGGIAGLFSGTAFGEDMLWKIDLWTSWVLPLPVGIQELMPQAAWQLGGALGAIWGAVTVAVKLGWLAFYWPWQHLYDGDPAWPVMLIIGQVTCALIVGTVYTVWAIMWEPARLKRMGARRMSRREAERIMPLVQDVGVALGLQGLPRVLVTDAQEVNAYAATRHIVLHKGLITHLQYDMDAVRGVIAHELAHWRWGDPIGSLMVKGVSLPLYLVYELAVKLDQVGSKATKLLMWVLSPILWGVQVCVKYVVAPVEAGASRRRELRADAAAMQAGYGPGLRVALEAFAANFDGRLDGWDDVMLRHHPHTEHRLELLEEPGRDYPWGPAQGQAPTARAATLKEDT